MVPFKPKLIPQLFSRFEVRNGSVRDCGDMGLLLVLSRHLSALMSHFFQWGRCRLILPHCLHLQKFLPNQCCNQHIVLCIFSTLSHVQVPVHMGTKRPDGEPQSSWQACWQPSETGDWLCALCLGRKLSASCLANRDFKSVEACLEFLRKSGVLVVLSSWDAYFVAYLWNPPLYGNRPSIWKRC